MSMCSSCKKYFIPLLKNNGLPYKTCDRCRCDDKKYKDTHKEQRKLEYLGGVLIFSELEMLEPGNEKDACQAMLEIRLINSLSSSVWNQ